MKSPFKTPIKKCIGIDPGKGGGLAVITSETVKAYPCPQTVDDMAMLIGMCLNDVSAFPTDGRVGSFTFGQNFGHWQGILASHELKPELVTPKTWQSHFEVQKGLPKDKRKKMLKQMAIERCPGIKRVTLKTCDAILIAIYGVEAHLSYENSKPWSMSTEVEKVA